MRIRSKLGLLCSAAAIALASPAIADDFQGLGTLSGFSAKASAISGDGLVIAGSAGSVYYLPDSSGKQYPAAFNEAEASLWTLGVGWVGLGNLTGGFGSLARGISGDGLVVVGASQSTKSLVYIPYLPTAEPPGGGPPTYNVTANTAFRWTQSGGMISLGTLPGDFGSIAYAASFDGSVIVGSSTASPPYFFSSTHPQTRGSEAFRWTQANGMVALGYLPGDTISEALDVSADGSVVVGDSSGNYSNGAFGYPQAFRWTQASGMIGLGFQPDDISWATAELISAHGSLHQPTGSLPTAQSLSVRD